MDTQMAAVCLLTSTRALWCLWVTGMRWRLRKGPVWESRSEPQTQTGSDMCSSFAGSFLKLSESRIAIYRVREQRYQSETSCH